MTVVFFLTGAEKVVIRNSCELKLIHNFWIEFENFVFPMPMFSNHFQILYILYAYAMTNFLWSFYSGQFFHLIWRSHENHTLTIFQAGRPNVVTAGLWVQMLWVDPRLAWRPSDYNNITTVYLPAKRLWLPNFAVWHRLVWFSSLPVFWMLTSLPLPLQCKSQGASVFGRTTRCYCVVQRGRIVVS